MKDKLSIPAQDEPTYNCMIIDFCVFYSCQYIQIRSPAKGDQKNYKE
jgi:hypothetical protein